MIDRWARLKKAIRRTFDNSQRQSLQTIGNAISWRTTEVSIPIVVKTIGFSYLVGLGKLESCQVGIFLQSLVSSMLTEPWYTN